MYSLNDILLVLASAALLFAVYYSFKLSRETNHERYWLLLSLGLFIFAIHHWLLIPSLWESISGSTIRLIDNVTSIFSGTLIAYSTYGLHDSMKRVKEKIE